MNFLKQRLLFFFLLSISFSFTTLAQNSLTVKGKVMDANGEALIGVSVVQKGTGNGTVTDINGYFSLEVKPSNTLIQFSYIGYKSLEISATANMNVTLREEQELLDEVVVIGYGTAKRKDVTTAVSSVSAKDFDVRPIVSAGQALQGKAAGVQVIQPNGAPGGETVIRVRGTTSLNGSSDPLYVVDGVPVDNINFLSPNDIDNINI